MEYRTNAEKAFCQKGGGHRMFQVGDKVVHPMHGAGVIDSIVREKISGKAMELYVFKMPISLPSGSVPSSPEVRSKRSSRTFPSLASI